MAKTEKQAMVDHMQPIHSVGTTTATMLLMFVVLLSACGPGRPHDPIQPTATTHDSSLKDEGSITSSPGSLAALGIHSKQNPPPTESLAVPEWMAQALGLPDVQVRLDTLETWVRRSGRGAVDPLMLALNDPDERVRNRAMQLIEEDWTAEQALLSNVR